MPAVGQKYVPFLTVNANLNTTTTTTPTPTKCLILMELVALWGGHAWKDQDSVNQKSKYLIIKNKNKNKNFSKRKREEEDHIKIIDSVLATKTLYATIDQTTFP